MTERELRALRRITDSLSAIQQDIRAIREQQEGSNKHQEIPPDPPVLSAELQIPERIERNSQANSNREYRVQKWLAFGTWLAFAAAAVTAGRGFASAIGRAAVAAVFGQCERRVAATVEG